jgi:hypothetical protein
VQQYVRQYYVPALQGEMPGGDAPTV